VRTVVVTGGRDYDDRKRVFEELDAISFAVLVHGACDVPSEAGRPHRLRGADRWADEWATLNEHPCLRHPARWSSGGRAAGPQRNLDMLRMATVLAGDAKYVLLLAFPGGRGTRNCIEHAEELGIKVRKVEDAR
jgi:hypothetical protein